MFRYSKKNKSLLKIYLVVLSVSSLLRFISNSDNDEVSVSKN